MKIVETNALAVETALVAGELHCPDCDGILARWAHARERLVRLAGIAELRKFRRSRCSSCSKTHVLVPNDTLVRRRDGIEVIGPALLESAKGTGFRKIAAGIDRAVNNLAVQSLIAAYATKRAIVDESTARVAVAEVDAD